MRLGGITFDLEIVPLKFSAVLSLTFKFDAANELTLCNRDSGKSRSLHRRLFSVSWPLLPDTRTICAFWRIWLKQRYFELITRIARLEKVLLCELFFISVNVMSSAMDGTFMPVSARLATHLGTQLPWPRLQQPVPPGARPSPLSQGLLTTQPRRARSLLASPLRYLTI